MKKLGILGCGNIANIVTAHGLAAEVVALYDREVSRSVALAEKIPGARACLSMDEFLAAPLQMVLESASVSAVQEYAEAILRSNRDLVVLSVGGLADQGIRQRLEALAGQQGCRIHVPTGALFGLDNLRIGQVSRLDRVLLRTSKPPAALNSSVQKRTLMFQGSASDCIRLYPKNVNVAVALELASGREVAVELWADPDIERNTHEVSIQGEFGQATIKVENLPSPDNPSTSYLAALSIIALFKNMDRPLQIGS